MSLTSPGGQGAQSSRGRTQKQVVDLDIQLILETNQAITGFRLRSRVYR